MPEIVINDRRGQNKEPVVRPETFIAPPEPEKDKSSWKDVAYMIVIGQAPNKSLLVIGRAVGLRSDGRPFVVDYLLPPHHPEEYVWTGLAKKRLDTFINCDCREGGMVCSTHGIYLPQWQQQDMERMNRIASQPLPEAIEVVMRAEMARQQARVVAPGR